MSCGEALGPARPGSTPDLRYGPIDVLASDDSFLRRVDHEQAHALLASGVADGIGRPVKFIRMRASAPREPLSVEWRAGDSGGARVMKTERGR